MSCSFITEMHISCPITLYDIESIYQLANIIRICILIIEQEFLKLRIIFSFEVRRIETDLLTVFKQFNQ